MDMDDAVAERGEEVLAVRGDDVEDAAVDECCLLGEATLRAGDRDRPAGEPGRLIASEPVQGVPLWHVQIFLPAYRAARAHRPSGA
jgi:hypothetical protein